jgi:hypothetical protein
VDGDRRNALPAGAQDAMAAASAHAALLTAANAGAGYSAYVYVFYFSLFISCYYSKLATQAFSLDVRFCRFSDHLT